MKKFLVTLLVLVGVLVVTTACDSKKNTNPLVGSWEFEGGGYTYTFNEDGTGSYSGMNFTYTTKEDNEKGKVLSVLFEGNTAPTESAYEIKDNKLIVKDYNGVDTVYKKK